MLHLLLRTKHFIPKAYVNAIEDIDFETLYFEGKRVLLIDLDNTLIPYDKTLPNKKLVVFFANLKTIGFEVVLISNNNRKRVRTFAHALKVPYVSSAKKPLKCGLKKALRTTDHFYQDEAVCIIGDQLMTDVFAASRMGLDAILVNPIKKKSEKWYTKFNRNIERNMLNKIKKKYPKHYKKLQLETRKI